jgi:uncharacterized membrane protein YhhN
LLKTILFITILASAIIDWVAVAKNLKKIEYIAKPATMLLLLVTLKLVGGFGSPSLICFALGIILSLTGDVFLMISYSRISNRWFLMGLGSFLLAHLAYILGLNIPFGSASPAWGIAIGILLALAASRFLRRILDGVRQKGLRRLLVPVVTYGVVITLMLLSAVLTLIRPDWKTSAAGLVSLGAILFYFSDAILAWNKFIRPIKHGRVWNMATYHLGQFALVAGIIFQSGK